MTESDLLIRKQLILQQISCISNEYNKALTQGKPNAVDLRNDIIVLQALLDMICCYDYIHPVIPSVGSIIIGTITNPTHQSRILNVYINGILLISTTSNTSDNIAFMGQVVVNINNSQSLYIATYNSITQSIDLINNENNFPITVNGNLTSVSTVTTYGFTGLIPEVIESDNCLTEKELIDVFDLISNKFGVCFPPLGAVIV